MTALPTLEKPIPLTRSQLVSKKLSFSKEEIHTITVEGFIENIEKNGVPQIKGNMFRFDKLFSELQGACALGQGLYNTTGKTFAHSGLENSLNISTPIVKHKCQWWGKKYEYGFTYLIIHLNDSHDKSLKEIGKILRKQFKPYLQAKVTWTSY